MLTPCRADALLLGVLGAIAMRDVRCRTWLARQQSLFHFVLLPVLLLGLAYFILRGYSQFVFPMLSWGFSWIAVFYLTVLLYAILWPASWLASCLRWSWLRGLGIIAYAAYLLHLLVLCLLHSLFWSLSRFPIASTSYQWAVTFASIAITLLLCRLSWVYFEKPLIHIGHRSNYNFANSKAGAGAPPSVHEGGGFSSPEAARP